MSVRGMTVRSLNGGGDEKRERVRERERMCCQEQRQGIGR